MRCKRMGMEKIRLEELLHSGENSAWQYRNLYLEMTRDKA